jgi:hypothetical protein
MVSVGLKRAKIGPQNGPPQLSGRKFPARYPLSPQRFEDVAPVRSKTRCPCEARLFEKGTLWTRSAPFAGGASERRNDAPRDAVALLSAVRPKTFSDFRTRPLFVQSVHLPSGASSRRIAKLSRPSCGGGGGSARARVWRCERHARQRGLNRSMHHALTSRIVSSASSAVEGGPST